METTETPDRLAPVLERFGVGTRLFHVGDLCGLSTFDAQPGRGFIHVLRQGEITISHRADSGWPVTRTVTAPSLILYPRPIEHTFRTPATCGSDFACATINVQGGGEHPLLQALPDVVVLGLDEVPTLAPTLELLFAEVDAVQCGRRLLADRLFEVALIQLLRWFIDQPGGVALPPGMVAGLADPVLAPALIAVHREPGDSWSVSSMAHSSALSRSAFAARFTQTVGLAPMEYVTQWRIAVAKDELLAGTSVSRVAVDAGYATPAAFTRAFTQHEGMSPRAWVAATRHQADLSVRPTTQARATPAA